MNTFRQLFAIDCFDHRRHGRPSTVVWAAFLVPVVLVVIHLLTFGVAVAGENGGAGFRGHAALEVVDDDPFVPVYKLREELVFRQADGTEWVSPVDAVIDGRSVPTLFVQLIGHPLEGNFRKSAISYDYAVKTKKHTWEQAQRMFYEALLAEGISVPKAKLMYLLLSGSGTRWAMRGPNSCFSRCHTDAKELEWRPRVDSEKLASLEAWVRAEDPALDQIDQRARAAITEEGPHIFGVIR